MIYSEDCCSLNDDSSASADYAYAFELFDCWIYLWEWCVEIIVEVGGASFLEER